MKLRNLLRFVPKSIRARFIRRNLNLPYELPEDLIFKIADSREELTQAFTLLHDSYVSAGFMKPHPSKMRVTLYHALPTTTTLVAKRGNKVVATISIISRDVFDLPLESIFDIEKVIPQSKKVVEISSLAVHPDYRSQGGELFFSLTKYMYHYTLNYFHAEYLIIAVNPKHAELYELLMGFKKIEQEVVDSYSFANGAPAVGMFLDLKQAHNNLLTMYDRHPAKTNCYQFFMQARFPKNFTFPSRFVQKSSDPVLSAQDLEYFFHKMTAMFAQLDDKQKSQLRAVYASSPEHLKVIPRTNLVPVRSLKRRASRHAVNFVSMAGNPSERRALSYRMTEISKSGLRLEKFLNIDREWPMEFDLRIELSKYQFIDVKVERIWVDGHSAGYRLKESSVTWETIIQELDRELRISS